MLRYPCLSGSRLNRIRGQITNFTVSAGVLVFLTVMGRAQTFTDHFEEAYLNSFWAMSGPAGNVSLTTAIAHAGHKALEIDATPTIAVQHDYGSLRTGVASVWIQGQHLCCQGGGAGLALTDSSGTYWALIQQSGNNNCPSCFVVRAVAGGQESDYTFSADANNWHHLYIDIEPSGTTFKFDGTVVYTYPSLTSFQLVQLTGWGGNGGISYFDDFSIQTGHPLPQIGSPAP